MKITRSISVIILTTLIFNSCKKDEENPTITINEPAEHSEYHIGDDVHIEATFTDDQELASYTFMIGDENGEHIHGFHHDDEGTISGKSFDYHQMVTIPSDSMLMKSVFYLHFNVTDAAGNSTRARHMLHIH
ncbi:MAG: hypothetical protein Kow0075_07870 [Salibacteraceae bacterium]